MWLLFISNPPSPFLEKKSYFKKVIDKVKIVIVKVMFIP